MKTAIHEAGHAVAHYRLGLEIGHVSILPDETQGSSGRCTGPGADSVWSPADAESQVIAFLAGYAALIAAGFPEATATLGADSDFEEVEDLISGWIPGSTLDEWKSKAVAMMEEPKNVAAVARVASELTARGRITGEHAMVCMEVADGESTEGDLACWLAFMGATGKGAKV